MIYEEGTVDVRTCQKWFAKFPVVDFSTNYVPQLDQTTENDITQMKTRLINKINKRYTSRKIAKVIKIQAKSFRAA